MYRTFIRVLAVLVLFSASPAVSQAEGSDQDRPVPDGKLYTYKTADETDLVMEVYFPPDHDPETAKVPGLILFHGGGWSGGSRDQFKFACAYFAGRGLVCATAEYRMHGRGKVPKSPKGVSRKKICVIDAKSAIRWFKEHAAELGLDPERVIAGGGSAGGHISALATMNADINDPSDNIGTNTGVVAYLWFNPAFSANDKVHPELTVLQNLKAEQPPTIAFFGDDDKWIEGWNATHEKWKSLGTETIELWMAPGQEHAFFNKEPWRTVTLIAADDFLVRHGLLEGKATLEKPEGVEPLYKKQ